MQSQKKQDKEETNIRDDESKAESIERGWYSAKIIRINVSEKSGYHKQNMDIIR